MLTGQTLIDDEVLRGVGITDFTDYAVDPTAELFMDIYIDN